MLNQDDRRRLAQLERQLLREDPDFVARMSGRPRRRRLPRVTFLTCCIVWPATVVLAIGGWWVAALATALTAVIASIAMAYAAAT